MNSLNCRHQCNKPGPVWQLIIMMTLGHIIMYVLQLLCIFNVSCLSYQLPIKHINTKQGTIKLIHTLNRTKGKCITERNPHTHEILGSQYIFLPNGLVSTGRWFVSWWEDHFVILWCHLRPEHPHVSRCRLATVITMGEKFTFLHQYLIYCQLNSTITFSIWNATHGLLLAPGWFR